MQFIAKISTAKEQTNLPRLKPGENICPIESVRFDISNLNLTLLIYVIITYYLFYQGNYYLKNFAYPANVPTLFQDGHWKQVTTVYYKDEFVWGFTLYFIHLALYYISFVRTDIVTQNRTTE